MWLNFFYIKFLLLLLVVSMPLKVPAADFPVKGILLDAETEEPLPFVSIVVIGVNIGTHSDRQGQFLVEGEGLSEKDTLLFSYFGYDTLRLTIEQLQKESLVYLQPSTITLQEIQLSALPSLSAEEIIEQVELNFFKNHPDVSNKQSVYFQKIEKIPFSEKNRLILKESDFVGVDKKTLNRIFQKMPNQLMECEEAMFDIYSDGENSKLVPDKAYTLDKKSSQTLSKDLEKSLSTLFTDIEKSAREKGTYFKVRTGVLGVKTGPEIVNDTVWKLNIKDSLNKIIYTSFLKYEVLQLLKDYTSINGDNCEFISKRRKYNYILKDVKVFNSEPVYEITFTPKSVGVYKGKMFVSTTSYAVLLMDFAYDKGKKTENFKLFGFAHSMKFKEGRVVFEKAQKGYFPKYLYAKQHESTSVERSFTVVKKKERFLVDKKLNEIKLRADLFFDVETRWEIVVLDRAKTDVNQLKKVKEPEIMKFKKVNAGAPSKFIEKSVITPKEELQRFREMIGEY